MSDKTLQLVRCWHMHQLEYWVWQARNYKLLGTRWPVSHDYLDRVEQLEDELRAKVIAKFVSRAVSQDFSKPLRDYSPHGVDTKAVLLAAWYESSLIADLEKRLKFLDDGFKTNLEWQINRFPLFVPPSDLALPRHPGASQYLNSPLIIGLLVCYTLIWLGAFVKFTNVRMQRLIENGRCFRLQFRIGTIEMIGDVLPRITYCFKPFARRWLWYFRSRCLSTSTHVINTRNLTCSPSYA